MKLHEAYAKINAHFSGKGIDANAVTDTQWNEAVKELGLESVFQQSQPPKPPNNPQPANQPIDMNALSGVISNAVNSAVKPMQDKIDKLEKARQDSEKKEAEAQKSQLQKDKQAVVDKLYKEKKINKEQRDGKYKGLIEDENFSLDNLNVIAESLPVNDAFADPDDSVKEGEETKETEIKTGKFNPNEDWGKQKSELNDEALAEIQSQISN
ncbi:MAG: hypothetical protein ABJI69_09215 [Balneola sp.]